MCGDFLVDDALCVVKFKISKYIVEGLLHFGVVVVGVLDETFVVLSAYGLLFGEVF